MPRGIILLDEGSTLIQVPKVPRNCPIRCVNDFIYKKNIDIAILNPYQITRYYTRPFALYFDLKDNKRKANEYFDYLIINIHQSFLRFTDTYPEYWAEIQKPFSNIQLIK